MGLTHGRQTKETYLLSNLPIDCHPNDKMCHHCVHYSVGKKPFGPTFAGQYICLLAKQSVDQNVSRPNDFRAKVVELLIKLNACP